jgi:predicted RNA-binding Zn ribbon-like protein
VRLGASGCWVCEKCRLPPQASRAPERNERKSQRAARGSGFGRSGLRCLGGNFAICNCASLGVLKIRLLRLSKITYKAELFHGLGNSGSWRFMAQKQNFLFLADHLCLDFVDTDFRRSGEHHDQLKTFDDLHEWLKRAGLLATSEAIVLGKRCHGRTAETVLKGAWALRKAIRQAAQAVADRETIPAGAIRTLNTLLSQRTGYFQIERRSSQFERRFVSPMVEPLMILAPIADSAADLLCNGDLTLVRRCADAGCDLLFYDTTKNHRRRWCSMSSCGNRAKVAAHRARQKSDE